MVTKDNKDKLYIASSPNHIPEWGAQVHRPSTSTLWYAELNEENERIEEHLGISSQLCSKSLPHPSLIFRYKWEPREERKSYVNLE